MLLILDVALYLLDGRSVNEPNLFAAAAPPPPQLPQLPTLLIPPRSTRLTLQHASTTTFRYLYSRDLAYDGH